MADTAIRESISGMPVRSIVYLLICTAGVLIFIITGIYPNQKEYRRQQNELKKIQGLMREQKMIVPLFKKMLEQAQTKENQGRSLPGRVRLTHKDIERIPSIFIKIAGDSRVELNKNEIKISTSSSKKGLISMDFSGHGHFYDLRNFLLVIGELPYLEKIDSIYVSSGNETKSFMIKLSLALE